MCIVRVLYVYYEGDFWRSAADFPRWGQSERARKRRPFRILNGGDDGNRTHDLMNAIHALSRQYTAFVARFVYYLCITGGISPRLGNS